MGPSISCIYEVYEDTYKMYFVLYLSSYHYILCSFSKLVYRLRGILKLIQTISTRDICIYTSSSQEIFLPRVRANTL